MLKLLSPHLSRALRTYLFLGTAIFTTDSLAQEQEKSLDQVLFDSSEFLRTAQADHALELLDEYQAQYGENREFKNNLAIAYLGNNQPEEALSILRQLVDGDPLFSIITHNLLEMELQLAGAGTEQVNPILFVQSVNSYIDSNTDTATNRATQSKLEEEAKALRDNAVKSLVQSWADAWSSKNFDRYIRHYSSDYQPENSLSHREWQVQRAERLAKPGEIEVTISNLEVSGSLDQPRVQFDQHYRSANYSDSTRKEMLFTQNAGRWKIATERTIKTY